MGEQQEVQILDIVMARILVIDPMRLTHMEKYNSLSLKYDIIISQW